MNGRLNRTSTVGTQGSGKSNALLLVLLLTAMFVPFLSETLFTTKGEPREAVVAVSMLNQGNWILPVSFGADIPYKPPMLAWCIALLGWINGGVVTEFLSRLPSALAAIAMLMATYGFFRRRTSQATALATVLITAGSFEFFRSATICRVDMLLTAFMVTSLYALYRQWERHPGGTWRPSLIAALLMSGAVLTKGPVGMLLPCFAVFIFRWIKGDGFFRSAVSVGASGLLSLVLPAMWYVAAYHQGGETFYALAMEENFGRFTGSMSYSSHEHPVWYNFTSILSGMAPYTLLALIGIAGRPWKGLKRASGKILERLRSMDAVELFAMLCAVLIFVFYCIPKSKRSSYLLPVYPFTAYFLALYFFRLARMAPRTVKAFGWVLVSIAAIASVALLSVMTGIVAPFGSGSTFALLEDVAAEGERFMPPLMCYVALFAAIGTGGALVRSNARTSLMVSMVFVPVIYMMVQASALPASMNYKSDLPLAERLEAQLPADAKVYAYRGGRMERFFTLNYYTSDRLLRYEVEQPSEGYLVTSENDVDYIARELSPSLTFTPIDTLGRSGEARSTLLLLRFAPKPAQ